MDAKKERALFITGLKHHTEKEAKMVKEYRALSGLVDSIPAGLLFDWVIAEEEAHQRLARNMIEALSQLPAKDIGNGTDGPGAEQDKVLFYTDRLRLCEERFAADCLYLKSQAGWEGGELFDALLDAMVMDSKKHQKILWAVEKMVKV